jgi:hypothetical protein
MPLTPYERQHRWRVRPNCLRHDVDSEAAPSVGVDATAVGAVHISGAIHCVYIAVHS